MKVSLALVTDQPRKYSIQGMADNALASVGLALNDHPERK
jgi:hypothetical protein